MNKIQAMALASGISGIITGMETELLQNIAAYLLSGKIGTDAAKWKLHKLAQLGKLHQKNIETIADYGGAAKEMMELTVRNAAVSAMKGIEPGFRQMVIDGLINDAPDGSMDKTMAGIINKLRKQAKNDLNIVNTTMLREAKNTAERVIRKSAALMVDQKYLDMIGRAAAKTVTGTESMTAAVSKCLSEIAEEGIPGFVDKRGRKWTPEAYVNMCVRSTVKNTETQALFDRMGDHGLRLIEISSHIGARPKCAPYQGRIYSLDNRSGTVEDLNGNKISYAPFSSTSYGDPAGLFGINCGHSGYPFIPGYSTQTYFPYGDEENAEQYRKIQKQRALEREVRASKRECAMLKDGDPEQFKKASVKLKRRTERLREYCKANDLTYQNERTSVLGYGKSEAGKVTAAYNKWLKEEEEKLDKQRKMSIIGSEIKDAAGNTVEIVKHTSLTGKPNSITQTTNKKGGVTRDYYGSDGKQTKQISNHNHGNSKKHPFGKNGEHAHDYFVDENGIIKHGKARELTDEEIKENGDIL